MKSDVETVLIPSPFPFPSTLKLLVLTFHLTGCTPDSAHSYHKSPIEIYSLEVQSYNKSQTLKAKPDSGEILSKRITNYCEGLKKMISYLKVTWMIEDFQDIGGISNDIDGLDNLAQFLLKLEKIIQPKFSTSESDKAKMDEIVHFNVLGEIFPISKSSIERDLPESQLAVRISGRWETQPKEKDSQGNLIVTQPKEPMMKLFSYLRLKKVHRMISNFSSPEVKLFSFAEYLAFDKDMDISFATSVYDYLGVVPSAV
jgi:hypothetical protein